MRRFLAILFLGLGLATEMQGQGTLNFANIGAGVHFPISGPDGPLGEGYFAQLIFPDGEKIGEPAPFLAMGYFSGGMRVIPGVPPGAWVELVIQVTDGVDVLGQSAPFSVQVGGALSIIAEPGLLFGVSSFDISIEQFPGGYYWDPEFSTGACLDQNGSIVSPLNCNRDEFGHPLDEMNEIPESLPPVVEDLPKRILLSVVGGGELELRWPVQYRLARSLSVGGEVDAYLTSELIEGGYHVITLTPAAPQSFFWLE